MEDMLKLVKIFLNIQDDLQDELLTTILNDMSELVLNYTGQVELPGALKWIVRELTIIRFNRIGSEGMKSEREEGKSMEFYDDPLTHYYYYLDDWVVEEISDGGKARFL